MAAQDDSVNQFRGINKNLGQVVDKQDSAISELTDVNSNLSSLDTTLGTINTNVAALDTTLGTINTNVAALNTTLGTINTNVAALVTAFETAFPLSSSQGTFTCANAATTTVTDSVVKATSVILWTPTNAAAGTLEGSSAKLYLSARTADTSFAVTTADASAAAGTETFQYIVVNVG